MKPILFALVLLLTPALAHAGWYIDVLGTGHSYTFFGQPALPWKTVAPATLGPFQTSEECVTLRQSLEDDDVVTFGPPNTCRFVSACEPGQ